MNTLKLYFLIIFSGSAFNLFSQVDSNQLYEVHLFHKKFIIGNIVQINSENIVAISLNGKQDTINKDLIRWIEPIDAANIIKGEHWYPNPLPGNYFFQPSGLPLAKGDINVKQSYLFFNSFNYGLTKNISLGAGFQNVVNPEKYDGYDYLYYINTKFTFKLDELVYVGGGGNYYQLAGSSLPPQFLSYLNIGLGNTNNNLTITGGLISGDDTHPYGSLSGMVRIKKHLWIISENAFGIVENEFYFLGGLRINERVFTADIGIMYAGPSYVEWVPILPYLSYTVTLPAFLRNTVKF